MLKVNNPLLHQVIVFEITNVILQNALQLWDLLVNKKIIINDEHKLRTKYYKKNVSMARNNIYNEKTFCASIVIVKFFFITFIVCVEVLLL